MMCTTAKFQSGAIDYAKVHGIALARIVDGHISYEVRDRHSYRRNYIPERSSPNYVWFSILQSEPNKTIYTPFSVENPTHLESEIFEKE